MTERKEGFAYINWQGQEYSVDVKHSERFKKVGRFVWKNKVVKLTMVMIGSGIPTTVRTVDYIDDDDNLHGHEVPGLFYVCYKDLKDGKDEAVVFAVSHDLNWYKEIGKAAVIVNPLKENKGQWGGKREGAGRPEAGTKAVLVRLTNEQHETLKNLGGSSWIQKKMNAQKDISGKSIVIDFDFGNWEAMTSEEVEKAEKDWGETAWNESGPYICTSPKDAIALIADQIECEITSNSPDVEKIDRLNDLLKDFVKMI